MGCHGLVLASSEKPLVGGVAPVEFLPPVVFRGQGLFQVIAELDAGHGSVVG